jgi:hypothetical protein
VAVDGPGFLQLHITATLETNGSVIRCVNFVDGSPRPLLSDSITAVFYGELPQNTHEETQLCYYICLAFCRTSQCPR